MPFATLSNRSFLLARTGWSTVGNRKITLPIFGTDRHGQVTSQSVSLNPLESSGSVCFIGTEGSIGYFAEKSSLRTADGKVITAGAVAEHNDPGDVFFEHALRPPSIDFSSASGKRFFESLRPATAFENGDRLAIRCISRSLNDYLDVATLPDGCTLVRSNEYAYCVLERDTITASLAEDWASTVLQLGRLVAHDYEEDYDQFDLDWDGFFLWYISALHSKDAQYIITFDAIQHSIFAKIQVLRKTPSPFRRVRCAYYAQINGNQVELEWSEKSWSPIVNGFLLSR